MDAVKQKNENECFICGLTREDLDRYVNRDQGAYFGNGRVGPAALKPFGHF
jgi:hypothetical protein